ncbi:N-acetylmuramoyl-L-alanine amidase [Pelagicoccus sp. SDUM812003]|nr:N-acetylmuramoyl-L-alanine amidase [Pelagicoccus sp. SDUM812003]
MMLRFASFACCCMMTVALWAEPAEQLKLPVDWERLEAFQGRVERADFERELREIYAPGGRWEDWMRFDEGGVWIRRSADESEAYYLAFARSGETEPTRRSSGLGGLKIAIDPGHLGGRWAEMERRHFAIGDGEAVREGDLTLATAKRLRALLSERGAEVWLTREDDQPATRYRAEDYFAEADRRLAESGLSESEETYEEQRNLLAERLFYRDGEIRARARRLNWMIRPDLALALHVNAVGWPDPENPSLVDQNDLHVLVNGCYLPSEVADDAQRFEMVWRIVNGYHEQEIALARTMARTMVEATGLPPYQYSGDNAISMDEEGYIWARNLLANRVFDCPVVFLEPWTANSKAVYQWAALGDYEGKRLVGGEEVKSLPALYAAFVFEALLRHFGE